MKENNKKASEIIDEKVPVYTLKRRNINYYRRKNMNVGLYSLKNMTARKIGKLSRIIQKNISSK